MPLRKVDVLTAAQSDEIDPRLGADDFLDHRKDMFVPSNCVPVSAKVCKSNLRPRDDLDNLGGDRGVHGDVFGVRVVPVAGLDVGLGADPELECRCPARPVAPHHPAKNRFYPLAVPEVGPSLDTAKPKVRQSARITEQRDVPITRHGAVDTVLVHASEDVGQIDVEVICVLE